MVELLLLLSIPFIVAGLKTSYDYFIFKRFLKEGRSDEFKKTPEYFVLKHDGDWFPFRVRSIEENLELEYLKITTLGSNDGPVWEPVEFMETIPLNYPGNHAFSTWKEAVRVIERIDDVELVEIDYEPFYGNHEEVVLIPEGFNSEQVMFERKSRDVGTPDDFNSLNEYMTAQFGSHNLDDVKLGAKREEVKV